MTRFTISESSPPSLVIVVWSALPCHRTAPEEAADRPIRARRKAPDDHQKGSSGRGKGTRRVSSRQRPPPPPPLHLSQHAPPPPPKPLGVKVNTHCQPCHERAGSCAAWRRKERRLPAWAKHEITVAMALAETLHHSAQKWWSNTLSHGNRVTGTKIFRRRGSKGRFHDATQHWYPYGGTRD